MINLITLIKIKEMTLAICILVIGVLIVCGTIIIDVSKMHEKVDKVLEKEIDIIRDVNQVWCKADDIQNSKYGLYDISAKLDELNVTGKKLRAIDRGYVDNIIQALEYLGKKQMISYTEEIEFLKEIRKW